MPQLASSSARGGALRNIRVRHDPNLIRQAPTLSNRLKANAIGSSFYEAVELALTNTQCNQRLRARDYSDTVGAMSKNDTGRATASSQASCIIGVRVHRQVALWRLLLPDPN